MGTNGMTRTWLTILLLAATLTCCAAHPHTPAETAYLEQVQSGFSALQIDDTRELTKGHEVCNLLSGLQPDARNMAAANLVEHGYDLYEVKAATTHLCPELNVRM
jgi:hypothetical protein